MVHKIKKTPAFIRTNWEQEQYTLIKPTSNAHIELLVAVFCTKSKKRHDWQRERSQPVEFCSMKSTYKSLSKLADIDEHRTMIRNGTETSPFGIREQG